MEKGKKKEPGSIVQAVKAFSVLGGVGSTSVYGRKRISSAEIRNGISHENHGVGRNSYDSIVP